FEMGVIVGAAESTGVAELKEADPADRALLLLGFGRSLGTAELELFGQCSGNRRRGRRRFLRQETPRVLFTQVHHLRATFTDQLRDMERGRLFAVLALHVSSVQLGISGHRRGTSRILSVPLELSTFSR